MPVPAREEQILDPASLPSEIVHEDCCQQFDWALLYASKDGSDGSI
jgi:hypothetical protein